MSDIRYTPGEFSRLLKQLGNKVPEILDTAIDAGLYELDAQIQQRIFNENEDINGGSFGRYKSKAYEKYRKKLGRDISKKDLQVFGNLKKSITKNYKENQLEFNAQKYALIADGQEKQMSNRIFEASQKEEEVTLKAINEVWSEEVNKLFND